MNKNIIKAMLVGATTMGLASCSENTWNDHFLDGFEGGANYEKAESGSYTLTADDYKAISDLMAAIATTDAEKAAAKAIATNCYFDKNSAFPASVALPPFFQTAAFPYYLASNGSQADVQYAEASKVPAELSALAGAYQYKVTTDDYKKAWASDDDYIDAFAPMTSVSVKLPGILKSALPDAQEGAYVVVNYNESAENPTFTAVETEEFTAGAYYLVADGAFAAGPVENKNYGYFPEVSVTVAGDKVNTDAANIFVFEEADGGFYIKDSLGRYVYQTGTYNSFNFSATLPADGAVWTVAVAGNGLATITNTSVNKWIQYSSNYNSWGSYNYEAGSLPKLYKAEIPFEAGSYFMVADGNLCATPIEGKNYGYLNVVEVSVSDNTVATDAKNAFTFEKAEGGFNIKDGNGKYLYQTGTYNSFNLSDGVPAEGGVWSVSIGGDGLATITNTSVNKWMQYDSSYSSYGSYNTEKGALPKLYKTSPASPAQASTRAVAGTPVYANYNAVYYFDGSKWAVADGVSVLNPSDYAAMGVSDNKLSDPEVYLPLYLKHNLIYAVAGDTRFVVYNTNKADLFVYDGNTWTLNNNGLETVVGRFVKKEGNWTFTKYIGKATFTFFNDDQLMLDRNYLMVYGNVCATPLDKSTGYGYLPAGSVSVSGTQIVLPSDANAFTFASKATVNGVEYKAPEGKFLIVDSNGRYVYYDGSHASSQMADTPTITDGAFAPGFCFNAYKDASGAWKIENQFSASDTRWLVYSTKYNNFALYNTITETDFYLDLYMMDE